jgi:hypothetical protein
MFCKWQEDQANLSSYARRLFGTDALAEAAKLLQKLVESAVKPKSGAPAVGFCVAGAAGIAGAHLGGLTLPVVTAAAAGFVVAVIFRAIEVWGETKKAERKALSAT